MSARRHKGIDFIRVCRHSWLDAKPIPSNARARQWACKHGYVERNASWITFGKSEYKITPKGEAFMRLVDRELKAYYKAIEVAQDTYSKSIAAIVRSL